MKIAIIGASGFVGKALVEEAVSRGHQVTAITRKPSSYPEQVRQVAADVANEAPEHIATLLKGHDIVLSAFNAGWTNPNLYADFLKGARAIQAAVAASGVPRLIVVGGAGSLYIAPGVQLVDTPEFPAAYKAGATAARDYLNELREETRFDWTFFSPAIEMHAGTSGIRKGIYRTGLESPVFDADNRCILSVEDLAVVLLDEAEHPQHIRGRFTAAY